MASSTSELETLKQRADDAERKLADIEKILSKHSKNSKNSKNSEEDKNGKNENDEDSKEHELTTDAIMKRLSNTEYEYHNILTKLLGNGSKYAWKCVECGDGNINYIFIIDSDFARQSKSSIVIKQAPPFIRLVGPSWPLKQVRCNFEVKYSELLSKMGKDNEDNNSKFKHLEPNNPSPKIHFYDKKNYLFCMENLSDFKIFRTQLGLKNEELIYYPLLGQHVGYMLANMLFKTSDLYLSIDEKVKLMNQFINNMEMVSITEQVIFEEPYIEASNNRRKINQTTKNSDISKTISKLRKDNKVLSKIYYLRELFRMKHESLLHGDLHTGSIMVNKARTVAIDAEFSFYGPMSFDIGLMIGNMALGLLAQPIYNVMYNQDRRKYQEYISEQIVNVWNIFYEKFLNLWQNQENGNLYPKSLRNNNQFFKNYQNNFMRQLYNDTLDYAASVMIRRCIGIADGPEYRVKDEKMRDECEDRAMRFAHLLLTRNEKQDNQFDTIDNFTKTLLQLK